MRALLLLVFAFFLCGAHAQPQPDPAAGAGPGLVVLAYHDVRDNPLDAPDRYTVSTRHLAEHFAWLRENGYTVVSLDAVQAARDGVKALPPKPVMLTFDDGYRSVYTRVFPLLKAFNYPAVVALVGSWLEAPEDAVVSYDDRDVPRSEFLHWNEIREMVLSGLVEIASHTYDLHRGIAGTPFGDALPAAVARRYNASARIYEGDAAYLERVRSDLQRNSRLIARELGRTPRAIVWPYGRHTAATMSVARDLGMSIGFTLQPGANTNATPTNALRRELVAYDPTAGDLAQIFLAPPRPQPMRVMHVDLDYVYDPDPVQQRANLGLLLDRVRAMGINTVFLQAYADPDGNGAADALYFPNRHLPVRADLFSHVAWQLHTRALVNVYAWMPVLAFELPADRGLRVQAALPPGKSASGYPRMSPYDPRARAALGEIYEDLGRHAIFQGLLFHDDATLTDFEDASAPALAHYQREWRLPGSVERIRADREAFERWTRLKSRHLTELTLELGRRAGAFQPPLPLARNLYARVVTEPQSETWFGQNLSDFLKAYDFTAIMAMPFMEGAGEPLPWLRELVSLVAKEPRGLERSVFELQSRDWRTEKPVDSRLIADKMRVLQSAGAFNFGYYPDDFHRGHPDMSTIKPVFSLEAFPYENVRPK